MVSLLRQYKQLYTKKVIKTFQGDQPVYLYKKTGVGGTHDNDDGRDLRAREQSNINLWQIFHKQCQNGG